MDKRPWTYLGQMSQIVSNKQERQKEWHDRGTVVRSYAVGESVWIWNFAKGLSWLKGVAMQNQGHWSLNVKLTDGCVVHPHLDHIRPRVESTYMNIDNPICKAGDQLMDPTTSCSQADHLRETLSTQTSEPRYSAWQRKPPDHLTY